MNPPVPEHMTQDELLSTCIPYTLWDRQLLIDMSGCKNRVDALWRERTLIVGAIMGISLFLSWGILG